MNVKDFLVVLGDLPGAEAAARIARTLVEDTLAACLNIVPGMRSLQETPERVAVRVADGHDAYLSWVAQATRAPDA